jgi:CcmD family protein
MMFEAGIAIYVAMAVALAVWIGVFFYLWRIDAQARALRQRLDRRPEREEVPQPTATLRVQQRPAAVERQAEELHEA